MSQQLAKAAKRPAEAAPARTGSTRDQTRPASISNQALQGHFQSRSAVALGAADDPAEAAADRIADRTLSSQSGAGPGGRMSRPAPPGLLRGPGRPLEPGTRRVFEARLGLGLDAVRVHSDPQTAGLARAIGAQAFAVGRDIGFASGSYAPETRSGRRLLAHELAHVAEGTDGTVLRRQPDGGQVCRASDGQTFSFIDPRPAPPPPASFPTEIAVHSATLTGQPGPAQTVVLQEPILSSTPITLYAIPIGLTDAGPSGKANVCVAPPASTRQGDDKRSYAPAPFLLFSPAPKTVTVEGVTLAAVRVTDAYVIVSQYHHFAVGAGATTLLETAQGVRLIDAGVGNEGHAAISAAIADQVGQLLNGRPIAEVLITHLHEDHTSLLPELAERFPIGRLRVNAVQFADPRFTELLSDIAAAQARGVMARAGAAFDARRAEWEAGPGSRVADVGMREAAFQAARGARIAEALRDLAANPTTVELLVPSGGRLVAANAPLGSLPSLTGATQDPVTEGLRRAGVPGDVSDVAFTDPGAGRELARQQERLRTDKGARVADEAIDTASTNWIIDLPSGNRLMVVPDVRTGDLRRSVRDTTGKSRSNLEAELARLGHPSRFQAWNMTHHMQSGWLEGGAPHIAGPEELNAFIELIHNVRTIQAAQRGPGQAAPADMVVVSAQHTLARSMVNPAMVWFLRSLGFDVFLATSGTSVRLIEALTAGGQNVVGVAGLPAGGLRPGDPLLLQSEAAIRYLEQGIQDARRPAPTERRMNNRDRQAAKAARDATRARLEAARDRVSAARDAYIRIASQELWRGPSDTTRPAVAPDPARPLQPQIVAAEQVLRDAMSAPELASFTPPQPGQTPIISDTALVLLRRQGNAPLDAQAHAVLEANQRADELRAKMQSGDMSVETRGQLTAALNELRGLIEAQLDTAPEASRPVLEEELLHTQRELESLVAPKEGQPLFSREPGTGRLVESRVVRGPPAEPTAADKVRSGAEKVGRVLGALMVIQTIRDESDVAQRFQSGDMNSVQALVGTTRNTEGVAVGLRMMTGVHVHPGEFVLMAVLDVADTALGTYDTREERNLAIARTAVQEAVSLVLLVVSQGLMRSGNPYLVGAGFALGLLTKPIMWALEELGVFDAIERWTAFLPSEVTAASQHLRPLIKDYVALIGAMDLARRPEAELRAMGGDPDAVRAASTADIEHYRAKLQGKETEVLAAFAEGYARAKGDYAGLFELDTLRQQFLELRETAHRGDAERNQASARTALAAFGRIDETLSMDTMTADEVEALPQWERLNTEMIEFSDLLFTGDIDWKDVREKETHVQQIMRNARYRLHPAEYGLRSAPLLSPGAPGRQTYEDKLQQFEQRLDRLESYLLSRATGRDVPSSAELPVLPSPPGLGSLGVPSTAGQPAVTTATEVEAALDAYNVSLKTAPSHPDATELYRSTSAADAYRVFVRNTPEYARYLERVQSEEMALRFVAGRLRPGERIGPPTEAEASLPGRIQSAISRRSTELGLVFLSELPEVSATNRQQEIARAAGLLGEPAGTHPLTDTERAALDRGTLEDQSKRISTITNRLQQIEGFHLPDRPDDVVGGVYRYVGELGDTDLFIISIPGDEISASDNILVGVQPGSQDDVTTGSGHDVLVNVIPLNAAAVSLLGLGGKRLRMGRLQSVTLRELQAGGPLAP